MLTERLWVQTCRDKPYLLITPEAPLIGTGMEKKIARDSGHIILAEDDGVVSRVSADHIEVKYKGKNKATRYNLYKFKRSNQGTCINQRPIVDEGQVLKKTKRLQTPSTQLGELALGKNLLVGFMTWEGYNYEDAMQYLNES